MSTIPIQLPHSWSKASLLAKAQRYVEGMLSHPHDDWRFAFWSTLALELLARAALAHVNPVLLADLKDWNNLYYALGHSPKLSRFTPRSLDITNVFNRLKEILPELGDFGSLHMHKRNEELHSGDTPFDGIKSSDWLPNYYQTCKVLLSSMGHDLVMLIGADEAKVAEEMITAAQDKTANSVMQSIQSYKMVWDGKSLEEKQNLSSQATVWATRYDGHRVKCPSCDSDAIINGEAIAAPHKSIKDDRITETQQYLPSKFECVACGLKISVLSQLRACGLGNTYTATLIYDADEYYQPNDDYPDYEPDYNEP